MYSKDPLAIGLKLEVKKKSYIYICLITYVKDKTEIII